MTSKERLERIENFIDGSPITKEYREKLNADIKEIEKDLEVLDILKRVIFLTNNSYYIQTKKRLNEEDYKLIKEWLENGL